MPIPNPLFVASVPLQYVFVDKDTGGPLSAGVVSFFSDPDFSVPKNVYEITNNPDNTITFTNLGNVLVLSSIGTFVDGSGDNLVPYYYPWTNDPSDDTPGDEELYFVKVFSSGGVEQFTLTDWPPNGLSGSSGMGPTALTQNLLQNPIFSYVLFQPQPGSTSTVISVTGSLAQSVAPPWNIFATGTGTINVEQISLNASIPSEAPYALSISWTTGFTGSINISQTLSNSPRIGADGYVNGSVVVNAPLNQAISVQLLYTASDSGPTAILAAGTTSAENLYSTISGTEFIEATNTDNASGDATFSIQIGSLQSAGQIYITSAQLVSVGNDFVMPAYIQQTTAQYTVGLANYLLENETAKPITNYLLGWNFPYNPSQEFGASHAAFTLGGANLSTYILDQTILFQAVDSSISFANSPSTGLTISTANTTSFCLIQYLDAQTAASLFNNVGSGVAFQICGGVNTGTLVGYINLYYTTDVTLPTISSTAMSPNQSLIAGMGGAGLPGSPDTFTFNGTWHKVIQAWDATSFTLTSSTAKTNLQQYTNIGSAAWTYLAVVVSFAPMPSTQTMNMRYITMCAGNIATAPAPTTQADTLKSLQYYYESSYPFGVAPPSSSTANALVISQPVIIEYAGPGNSNADFNTGPFGFQYQQFKRSTSPIITFYANGSANKAAYNYYVAGSGSTLYVDTSGGGSILSSPNISSKAASWLSDTNQHITTSAQSTTRSANLTFQYTVDARFGVV